ncbi:MAG: hypothetical protein AAGG01_07510, partial [Planctomycetota bacterium]
MQTQMKIWRGAIGSAALALSLTSALAAPQAGPYLEEGGLVVIEFESSDAQGSWARETSIGGYTGSEYLRWDGPNLF